jgi:hypothetical protein
VSRRRRPQEAGLAPRARAYGDRPLTRTRMLTRHDLMGTRRTLASVPHAKVKGRGPGDRVAIGSRSRCDRVGQKVHGGRRHADRNNALERRPATAPPPERGERCRDPQPQSRVVGRARQPPDRFVEGGSRRLGDGRVRGPIHGTELAGDPRPASSLLCCCGTRLRVNVDDPGAGAQLAHWQTVNLTPFDGTNTLLLIGLWT